jgi:hypothetical protein
VREKLVNTLVLHEVEENEALVGKEAVYLQIFTFN